MRLRLMLMGLVLGSSLLFGAHPLTAQATEAPPAGTTPVAVAEDKTVEADCRFWVGSSAAERPCDPGSVIFVRPTTYRTASAAGITDYAILTGNAAQDQQIRDTLAETVHQRIRAAHTPSGDAQAMGCWNHAQSFNGSYLSIPSDSNSTRMFYQVSYQVWVDCAITWVQDQSRTSGPQMNWLQSCSKGTLNCSRRDILVGGNWTAWHGMFDTRVDAEYRHLSAAPCWSCGMPYGFSTFKQ